MTPTFLFCLRREVVVGLYLFLYELPLTGMEYISNISTSHIANYQPHFNPLSALLAVSVCVENAFILTTLSPVALSHPLNQFSTQLPFHFK